MKNTPRTEIFETFAIQGMTLRDYFAAKAMQAYLSDTSISWDLDIQRLCATKAYQVADVMMKARNNAT